MAEESLKRNTDCVYFLASPLTCKKGVDCEYRHSEMARLNPRDCWYWFSGNCMNSTCAFRHPPMDTYDETSAKAERYPHNTVLPTSKNNVPCYFYFNGYCGKGEKCTFLHGTEDTSAGKLKIDSAPTIAPTLCSKSSSEAPVFKITAENSDTKVSSTLLNTNRHARMADGKIFPIAESVLDLPEMTPETGDKVSLHQKMQFQSSDTYTIIDNSVPSEFEVPAMFKSASLDTLENMNRSDPSLYSDQSSDDQDDKDVVRDECWESSPGFDVLVEGKSEGVTYGVEQDYMHVYNDLYGGSVKDHDIEFLDHNYRDQNEYGDRFLNENRIREASYYSDDEGRYYPNDYYHRDGGRNRIMSEKRKLPTIGLPNHHHYYGEDLREHLSKRRFHEERDVIRVPSFPLQTQERRREPRRSSNQRLNGRLMSKVERNGDIRTSEKSAYVVPEQRGKARNIRQDNHHEKKRRLFSRPKRESNNDVSFAPPKTLAQIKEEKDRARGHVSLSSESSQISSR